MTTLRRFAAIALLIAASAPIAAKGQTAAPINVNVFPGANALPAYICVEKGFCEVAGVPVKVIHTASSTAQMDRIFVWKE